MPLTPDELIIDLPALLAFYQKIRDNLATVPTVTPPVDPADKSDETLAMVQVCAGDFVALLRTIRKQAKS